MRLACTTSEAADISDYNYVLYCKDSAGFYHVFLSDKNITTLTKTTVFDCIDFDAGYTLSIPKGAYKASLKSTLGTDKALRLTYNGVNWESYCPLWYTTGTQWIFFTNYEITNSSTTPLSGMPDIELPITLSEAQAEIDSKINTALNSTSSASTQANNIQTQITNTYVNYIEGNISLSELQATINDLQNQLDSLNSLSSTTLADKVAITNATLQVQLVQDAANKDEIIDELQTDLKVSSNIQSQITGKINEANQTFQNYSQGNVTQTQAVTQINQYITYLTSQITPQTPTADIEAINAAINTINGIKDSITNHSDLDNNVSDEAQQSDQEEKEYLEDITAETTENINTLKAKVDTSISESQANEVKEQVITPLLQNTLIVKILPIAALFMVLAVTLGFKYKL